MAVALIGNSSLTGLRDLIYIGMSSYEMDKIHMIRR